MKKIIEVGSRVVIINPGPTFYVDLDYSCPNEETVGRKGSVRDFALATEHNCDPGWAVRLDGNKYNVFFLEGELKLIDK